MIGDEKTVMYIIIPSSDDTFNFFGGYDVHTAFRCSV